MIQFISFFSISLFSLSVWAQQVSVLPNAGASMTDLVLSAKGSVAITSGLEINLYATCYSRNLRGVKNPIGRNTRVTMHVDLPKVEKEAYQSIQVEFPSQIVVRDSESILDKVKIMDKDGKVISAALASGVGNVLKVNILDLEIGQAELDKFGNVLTSQREQLIGDIRFIQDVQHSITGQYRAANGPISADVRTKVDNKTGKVEVYANFPGENGFCGGYYSPLALFIEDSFLDVSFENHTTFSVNEDASAFYWPSAKERIYFLAHDTNKDGKINSGHELFGESKSFKNGFDDLARFDSNMDKLIDHKDKLFHELVLWRDKNGNGVSEPSELVKLSEKGIRFISLNYRSNQEYTYGNRAKAKERSHFVFQDKSGHFKKGDIFDIWLSPKLNYQARQ
ncbi:MAG: hypothetical protein KDD33_02120 [Bdellovibrionales bacterium]|nr:hypothetical protein [Bdellovibrionales bacterium]